MIEKKIKLGNIEIDCRHQGNNIKQNKKEKENM